MSLSVLSAVDCLIMSHGPTLLRPIIPTYYLLHNLWRDGEETEDGTRRGGVGDACGPSDVLPITNQKITDESGDHFQN